MSIEGPYNSIIPPNSRAALIDTPAPNRYTGDDKSPLMASRLAAKQSDTGFKNEATIGAERAMSFCLSFIQARFPVSCQSNAISIATVSILTALLAPAVEATYDFFSRRLDSVPRPNTEGIRHILKEMDF
jgi:hypothetical protein